MKKSSLVIFLVVSFVILAFLVIPVIGIMVAVAVPGFLRAREISRRNACQENQVKIEGAVMQYVLEHRLSGIGHDGGTGFLDFVANPKQDPMNQQSWLHEAHASPGQAALFGEGAYVRFLSICPGGGYYHLQDPESPTAVSDHVVYCTLRHRSDVAPTFFHVFPGEDAESVMPLPGQ